MSRFFETINLENYPTETDGYMSDSESHIRFGLDKGAQGAIKELGKKAIKGIGIVLAAATLTLGIGKGIDSLNENQPVYPVQSHPSVLENSNSTGSNRP